MKTTQIHLRPKSNPAAELRKLEAISPQLILAFGHAQIFRDRERLAAVRQAFPQATLVGCSTAGEIANDGMFDHTLVLTATHFEGTEIRSASTPITGLDNSWETGATLARELARPGLKAIFVVGRGLVINGSALIKGLRSALDPSVVVTGGLAGDSGAFAQTFTVYNDEIADDRVVAFGLYGDNVEVHYQSRGGWEAFGPVRRVTKSVGSVMYEIDGEPALDIYKQYLGERAKELPRSGLFYPFAILDDNQDSTGIVRTILAVDEATKSLTFAGDIPQDGLVRLMHADNDRLVAGARAAADRTRQGFGAGEADPNSLNILVSCVGRKLVMGDDVDDELDAVRESIGAGVMTGFYSYGEIAPITEGTEPRLHNQTMTVTSIREKSAHFASNSKRLSRQVRKAMPNVDFETSRTTLRSYAVEGHREDAVEFLDGLPDLMTAVSASYEHLEGKATIAQRSLEIGSAELTKANESLFTLNQNFNAMVNSLGQGFVMFDREGNCLPVFSKACDVLFGARPQGQKIWQYLQVPAAKQASFADWCKMLFEDLVDFEDLAALGPKTFDHVPGRVVGLEYKADRDKKNGLRSVVVIATDRTREVMAQQEAYRMHSFATMVSSILKDKNQFRGFVQTAQGILEQVSAMTDQAEISPADWIVAKRGLHTLKGTAGSFGLFKVRDVVHNLESGMAEMVSPEELRAFVKKGVAELKGVFNSAFRENRELFGFLNSGSATREVSLDHLNDFVRELTERGAGDLAEQFSEQFVRVPMSRLFERFNSILQGVPAASGKKVDPLQFEGDDVRLNPEQYEEFFACLTHVFRNAVDHGIETEKHRQAQGKNPVGHVRVTCARAILPGGPGFRLVIEDDGRGIDPSAIRAQLFRRGQVDLADHANEAELMAQIFESGFSTAEKVTEFSGRGIGLEAVKSTVEKLGGHVTVSSRAGRGTAFTFELPLQAAGEKVFPKAG